MEISPSLSLLLPGTAAGFRLAHGIPNACEPLRGDQVAVGVAGRAEVVPDRPKADVGKAMASRLRPTTTAGRRRMSINGEVGLVLAIRYSLGIRATFCILGRLSQKMAPGQ